MKTLAPFEYRVLPISRKFILVLLLAPSTWVPVATDSKRNVIVAARRIMARRAPRPALRTVLGPDACSSEWICLSKRTSSTRSARAPSSTSPLILICALTLFVHHACRKPGTSINVARHWIVHHINRGKSVAHHPSYAFVAVNGSPKLPAVHCTSRERPMHRQLTNETAESPRELLRLSLLFPICAVASSLI
jgi:hypothetical protein